MFWINKITSDGVIDYAAEELKKYLRMMMPECGDIKISYNPDAKDGFMLGLMQDFGLDTSDAEDVALDDILYIDTNGQGGIIAGDNPRSVLLSVYEYLRQNGCRWLMPGLDGEFIPQKDILPVKYRHKPDMRYRGWCNEGAQAQKNFLDMIDFTPKVGMNVCMFQFRIPKVFYERYYAHINNEENYLAENISNEEVISWTRQCEAEASKRGLQLHAIGHGFTVDPFGIDSSGAWKVISDSEIGDEERKYLAMLNGKRSFFEGIPVNTNFCMSNPEARSIAAKYIAEYAKNHSNIDYIHVWLADGCNNHCECENCRKKTPSDWYVIFMNDIDEELKKLELDTKIVFIHYVDTVWPPLEEKIKNPSRFTLMTAPITRSYTKSVTDKMADIKVEKYVLNNSDMPQSLDEFLTYFKEWKKVWSGANLCYEYYFWRHQFFEPSGIVLAKRIYEDVHVYNDFDINGLIQCGSERSFFPNGFAYYVHARSHFDLSTSFEEIKEDYFKCAYGKYYKDVIDYLEKVAEIFDFAYLEGEKGADGKRFYNIEYAKRFSQAQKLCKDGALLVQKMQKLSSHVQYTSKKLLHYHVIYLDFLGKFLKLKAEGDEAGARTEFDKFRVEFGKFEAAIQPYYDHFLAFFALECILNNTKIV